MDVGPALVADREAAQAAEPGQGALDDPAVPAQTLAAVHTASGNPGLDPAPAQGLAAAWRGLTLVGVELGGAQARQPSPLSNGQPGAGQVLAGAAAVDADGLGADNERDAVGLCDDVPLGTWPAAIRRVRAGALALLLAGADALSRQARRQSMAPARPSRFSRTRGSRSLTPASCHSRKRRQQVRPEPQPIPWGSISQGSPKRSTNRMPVRAARFGTQGRPP